MTVGSIFIRLAVVAFQVSEITRNFYEVVGLGANRKRTYNFLLVISR